MNDPTPAQRFDAIEGLLVQQYRDLSNRLRRMEEQQPTQAPAEPSPPRSQLKELDQFFLKQRAAFGKSIQAALPPRAKPTRGRTFLLLLVLLNLISLTGHAALALWR